MQEYSKKIFTFGSNRAGIHGKGAAFIAKLKYGAIQGQGEGLMGLSYGIPTKCERLRPLPLTSVRRSVDIFIDFAKDHPDWLFMVTPIGTGLAGFKHDDIGPMFSLAPSNCTMPAKWRIYLYHNENFKYWNC